jgi:hypothetical protein
MELVSVHGTGGKTLRVITAPMNSIGWNAHHTIQRVSPLDWLPRPVQAQLQTLSRAFDE